SPQRGEGWGEGGHELQIASHLPPHPARHARRPLPAGVFGPGTSRTVVELEPIENSHFRTRRGVRSRFGPGKIRGSAWIAWKSLFGRNHGVKGLDRYAAAKAALDAMVRVQNLVFQAIQAWLPDSPKCLRCLRSKHGERWSKWHCRVRPAPR